MAKTPLLLVPGLLCSPRLFAAQLAGLSAGADIVVPDSRKAPLSVWDTWDSAARWVLGHMPAQRISLAGLQMSPFIPAYRLPDKALVGGEVMTMCGEIGVEIYKRQEELAAIRVDRRPDLTEIKCPTIVVCGRDDAATPLFLSEEMASAIKGSELIVVEQCGRSPRRRTRSCGSGLTERGPPGPHHES